MKAQVVAGVTAANLGVYSYQNMNFSLCRILLPVMNGTIPANTTFPPATEDQKWDFATITAYAAYVAQNLFQPSGVSGPTFTHPDPDSLAYAFPAVPAGILATSLPTLAAQAGTCRWTTC